MYPQEFIEWIGDNNYFRSRGIWYAWPDAEKQEVPIAETTEELYLIWEEQNKITK